MGIRPVSLLLIALITIFSLISSAELTIAIHQRHGFQSHRHDADHREG
jgi:hypothetical protein